ncbi:MAG TPA: MlaE family lipid ABC transporter permease subunit, partial [Polyangiaceae bacterium]|nr:MlaE family lipid ABC transporter permease subunit [Polyangiaceae bacterium]
MAPDPAKATRLFEGWLARPEKRPAPFRVALEDGTLVLSGELRMENASAIWREVRRLASSRAGSSITIDLARATAVDGAVMALLVDLRAQLAERGVTCEIGGANERIGLLVHLYGGDVPPRERPKVERTRAIEELGRGTHAAFESIARAVAFVGEVVSGWAGVIARPATGNFRAVVPLTERAGADGVPIVVLLNFLVGFVMGFQSAKQLELYGANLYVSDVVGISVTRELAPLMTAIIVSGRSGASFAAEIGTMRVGEEIDALRTLGLAPVRFLVLPRVVALALVTPALTMLGDVVGVLGGAAVGASSLGITPAAYLSELRTAVFPWDVITGLIKSFAFGIAIALIGCQQGFATRGGAAGVGDRTTATVVICLFMIVIIDT